MSNAALNHAKTLREQGDWAGSARALEPVLRSEPGNAAARYYYAMALLESGRAGEAKPHFEQIIRSGKHLAQAQYMLGRSLTELNEVVPAGAAFEAAHRLGPTDMTLRAVANQAWMRGDMDRFAALLGTVPDQLAISAYGLWVEAECLDEAEAAWTRLPEALRSRADAQLLRNQHMRQIGDGPAALMCAQAAHAQLPDHPKTVDALATAHLMCGDGPAALQAVSALRRADPNNQHWIAHEASALRIMDDDRYARLVDMDSYVRAYELPIPDGFQSVEAFNAAFISTLHGKPDYSRHPIDQSLRNGIQTAQSLLLMADPTVQAYIRALDVPIRQYMADIGSAPDHPLTARNTGNYRIRGCWSVRLRAGGRHVNHVHPQGWISSAYYAAVPEETGRGDTHAGWIKFGEPPFVTDPPLGPEKWVQPRAGLLVLFPSYVWHGTEPISEGAERVTAPFDVEPVV